MLDLIYTKEFWPFRNQQYCQYGSISLKSIYGSIGSVHGYKEKKNKPHSSVLHEHQYKFLI